MTDQQQHLSNLVNQSQRIIGEIEQLTKEINLRKETFLKVQGAIEYLGQIGVTLPENNEEESTEEKTENESEES
jgi:prefoldin subunit 5